MKPKRSTTAKTEILAVLNTSDTALSHSDIQLLLPDNLCDRVTIYRVLDRLIDEGFIHKVVNTDGIIKYAKCHNCSESHHHGHIHFSCEKCKSVTCLEEVEPSFTLPEHYKLNEINFVVSGLCPQCL